MNCKALLPALSLIAFSCHGKNDKDTTIKRNLIGEVSNIYPTIATIPLPEGYKRIDGKDASFSTWLRAISLKKDKTVYLFDGNKKNGQSAQFAVLNISVGDENLQQCADAVMRLRAEYLFAQKKYSEIFFSDNGEGEYQFEEPYSKEHLNKYLLKVFRKCGSASLSRQLIHREVDSIQPGDVFIRGGFPGHAAIVMDVAENGEGKKIFMLAQSYMPAQDIHVLVNPMDKNLSPWYEVNNEYEIVTPEYVFKRNELKSWEQH